MSAQKIIRNVFNVRAGGHVASEAAGDLADKLRRVMAVRGGAAKLSAAMDAILDEEPTPDEDGELESAELNTNGLPPARRLLTTEARRVSGPLRPGSLLTAPPKKVQR